MTTNKFWITSGVSKSTKDDVSKAYVDKKFITLSSDLNTKANNSGEIFTGNIDLSTNKIMSSY